ncbi:MAG: TonB-dependent receptor [Parvularculaceae bacterium]
MTKKIQLRRLLSRASIAAIAMAGVAGQALAQDATALTQEDETGDVVIVTGTRIANPNVVAASPVTTVGQEEISRQVTPNLERVFRDLPITIPGDGENVNNGTAGAATIDLRGLGDNRALTMIDGKRLVPFNDSGTPDINMIPLNLIERVDVITGGASAVYGSDAMSGAINFITRRDFEGVEVSGSYSLTEEGDGDTYDISTLVGGNFADGRGNAVLSLNYTSRSPVTLAARPFGVFGVDTESGAGVGGVPTPADPSCDAPFADAVTGSTTAIPTALDLVGGTLQFRNDGSLGDRCSRFNFNPFNYYQTPQERFGITAVGHYEINDHIEAYFRGTYGGVNIRQQIAPSGLFGNEFEIPLMNPFLTASARQSIIDNINSELDDSFGGMAADGVDFTVAGVNDLNMNGILDLDDSITVPVRRRTLELGPRSENYDNNMFQMVVGFRGELPSFLTGWNYDLSFQYGETDRTTVREGYTNLEHFALGINTVDAATCTTPGGDTENGCIPINIFGPFGAIDEAMAEYGQAIAFQTQGATQAVLHGSVSGPVNGFKSPWADTPLNAAFGMEYRRETGFLNPDLCLRVVPESCQGGAGGYLLPISTAYKTWEGFVETIFPVIENRRGIENFSIEAGFRFSDFSPTEDTTAWKAGFNWNVTPTFRVRYMEQQAVRTPNIEEIGSPIVTSLDNADYDPCSTGNPNGAPAMGSQLYDLCVATGVPPALIGSINDIVSGQVNIFAGTDPNNIPGAETARTRTVGFVWTPDLGGGTGNTTISVDYYRIHITDYIDQVSGQEAFDLCYVAAVQSRCDSIVRDVAGRITTPGTGLLTAYENFPFFDASGIEFGVSTDFDLGSTGQLVFSMNGNYYLKNEYLGAEELGVVTDCKGKYSTSCDPLPTFRSVARLTWMNGPFETSLLWRHLSGIEFQGDLSSIFDDFEHISAHDYFDLSAGWQINDNLRVYGVVKNLLDKDPPIIGQDTGTTSYNNGNTVPSLYDTLGRTYSLSVKMTF